MEFSLNLLLYFCEIIKQFFDIFATGMVFFFYEILSLLQSLYLLSRQRQKEIFGGKY